ncbi:MAG TPA: four-carbon acid sugar kinase family protein, partial [Acidobacteriaceae bacterium]|nr:four-carbon acid sugar kinase family protein [Acidobacteriaceae bacterium]
MMLARSSSPQRQAAPVAKAMPPVILVADDLTGACDSAAAFLGKADVVRVLLHSASFQAQPGTVTALSTETRSAIPAEAARIVECTVQAFLSVREDRILFKKVDSAGRGHLLLETMATLRSCGATLALVAPAFPEAGRTVSGGVLHIRDSAKRDTSLDLATIFQAHCGGGIDLLPVGKAVELERAVRHAVEHGTQILICDAETQRDLDRLAAAACRIQEPILWTGSAGLARALASQFPSALSERPVDREWPTGRVLLFVGTDHPVTSLQVSHLEREPATAALEIHRIEWNDSSAEYIRKTFSASPVATLILTGGDTAALVLGALNARAVRLAGELAPGVPCGFIEGGDADGCAVLTKSGGFGQEDMLTNAV